MINTMELTGGTRVDFAEEQKRKVMTLFLDVWDQACVEGDSERIAV